MSGGLAVRSSASLIAAQEGGDGSRGRGEAWAHAGGVWQYRTVFHFFNCRGAFVFSHLIGPRVRYPSPGRMLHHSDGSTQQSRGSPPTLSTPSIGAFLRLRCRPLHQSCCTGTPLLPHLPSPKAASPSEPGPSPPAYPPPSAHSPARSCVCRSINCLSCAAISSCSCISAKASSTSGMPPPPAAMAAFTSSLN